MNKEYVQYKDEQSAADIRLEIDNKISELNDLMEQHSAEGDISEHVIVEKAKDLDITIEKAKSLGIDFNIYEDWAKL